MTIHHATVKRAASLGIVLTENDIGIAHAHHAERNRAVDHTDPKVAVFMAQLAARLALEYPQVVIKGQAATVDDEEFINLDEIADDNGDPLDYLDPDALDEAFAQIVDAIPEGSEPEEEDEPIKIIVAERYKKEYAARGDANGCGDWLFQALKRYTTTHLEPGKKAGKEIVVHTFNDHAFTAMLIANGVGMDGKFADLPMSGQKGWEGRYKMNGRQKLELPVCKSGVLRLEDGTAVAVPADDLYTLRTKHPALLEEIETAEEEAKAAAKPAKKGKK